MLSVRDLTVYYGPIMGAEGIGFAIQKGEAVAILGPNGAGKSTVLNALMNLIPKRAGKVHFDGEDVSSLRTEELVSRGMTLVPEGRRLFPSLTVEETIRLVLGGRDNPGNAADEVWELFPGLAARRKHSAGLLSGGEAQQLAIARAVMTGPALLLLDEPSLGLSPKMVEAVLQLVQDLRDRGTTILIVEQDAFRTLEVVDRAYVMKRGRIEVEADAADLRGATALVESYLGRIRTSAYEPRERR